MARPRRLGYGEGSVYQEKSSGRWRGALTIDGKTRRVSGLTRTEALAKLDELRKAVDDGVPIGEDWRLGQWLDWYSKTVVAKKHPNTAANYAWSFEHLKPIHGKRLRELTPRDVERLLLRLAKQTPETPATKRRGGREKALGTSSLRRIKANLGAAIQKAEARDLVSRNVARIAELPPEVMPPKETRALTQDEANSLLSKAKGERNEALFLVAIMIGLRPGEVLGLQWNAIDLKAKTLDVRQSLHLLPVGRLELGPPKASSYRTLRLPTPVVNALRAHRTRQKAEELKAPVWEDHDLVFPNAIGAPMDFSNLRRTVRDICGKADVDPISPNELRHSAATLLIESGASMQEAADVLGHQDTRMLAKHYRHKRGIVDVTERQDRMLGA